MRKALPLLLLIALPVLGQESASSKPRKEDSAQGPKGRPKKVLRLDAITVEGRIQKPQAFYILPRSSLSVEEFNRSESFVPKVVKSVEKEPL